MARDISIHAPHTGRDQVSETIGMRTTISIHAPHTGRDDDGYYGNYGILTFQSTRPIRGATGRRAAPVLPPRISIHAPHTGRDQTGGICCFPARFQSTRPIRGATDLTVTPGTSLPISIHAPHTGRDQG